MAAFTITNFLHSRPGGRLISLVGLLLIVGGRYLGANPTPEGIVPTVGGWAGTAMAIVTLIAIIALLRLINKQYNIMRSESSLGAPLIIALAASTPWVATTFWPAWLLPALMLTVACILFSTFGSLYPERTVFLIFTLITAAAFILPQTLFFLPIALLGCMQVRIFSFRVFLAAILGVITPLWIALGFGLTTIYTLPLPAIDISAETFAGLRDNIYLIAGAAAIALSGLAAMSLNLYKLLSYKAVTRATNGFLALLFLASVALCIVDAAHLVLYLPLLITLAGYQLTLMFVIRRTPHSWIAIAIIIAIFWGLFFLNLWTTLPQPTVTGA